MGLPLLDLSFIRDVVFLSQRDSPKIVQDGATKKRLHGRRDLFRLEFDIAPLLYSCRS